DARDDTLRCIESVLQHMPAGTRLVLVDDASKDPELVDALDRLSATNPRVRLVRQETNAGFVATANAGMRLRNGRDVVLLNGDTAADDLKRQNYRTLERLHPTYFQKVARFVETNPLSPVHANLHLAMQRRRAAGEPALLVLLHSSFDRPGGGTEFHVRDLVQ